MANIKAKIRQTSTLKGATTKNNEIVAQTVKLSQGSLSLGDLTDVNTSGQSDGVMMIYDATEGEYKVTSQIENDKLNIMGGTY